MDPENGFLLSFLGFTCGVGLCEEATKAIPIVRALLGTSEVPLRRALLLGLSSGVGFGVAEGVTYCSDFYNGLYGADTYVLRFVSCVALHAMWSASSAMALVEQRKKLQGLQKALDMLVFFVQRAFVPMVLHGLYDTLLKQGQSLFALGVAVVTFAWFAFQYERAVRRLSPAEAALT
jgi:RsiW-degrading membrane proteinase PrsW (M82 family)